VYHIIVTVHKGSCDITKMSFDFTMSHDMPQEAHDFTEDHVTSLIFFFISFSSESEELHHFTFVLTDLDSKYRFGFCRYPPKLDSCTCFVR